MTILIHGKEYVTVAERLTQAHKDLKQLSITTEVLFIEPKVVIRATVITLKGTFTGISAANSAKLIEKESPYEVAESSAVGRALAFAGYETTLGIASAEEIKKANIKDDPIMKVTKDINFATDKQKKMIFAVAKQKGVNDVKEVIKTYFKLEHFEDLTLDQAKMAIDQLLKRPDVKQTNVNVDIPERDVNAEAKSEDLSHLGDQEQEEEEKAKFAEEMAEEANKNI